MKSLKIILLSKDLKGHKLTIDDIYKGNTECG